MVRQENSSIGNTQLFIHSTKAT